jgi:hypothetical protein
MTTRRGEVFEVCTQADKGSIADAVTANADLIKLRRFIAMLPSLFRMS